MRGSVKNACSLMLGFCVGCALYNIMHTTVYNTKRLTIPMTYTQDEATSPDDTDDGREVAQGSVIPRIIHQSWDSIDIPVQFEDWILSWRHNHAKWQYWFWTDYGTQMVFQHREPYVISMYKDPEIRMATQRSAIRKYLILYQYGGVFPDLDVESLESMDTFIRKHSCFIAGQPFEHQHENTKGQLVSPSIMGCSPGHPFLRTILDLLPDFISTARSYTDEGEILAFGTGSAFLQAAYEIYQKLYPNDTSVYVAPPEHFMPTYDSKLVSKIVEECRVKLKFSELYSPFCKNLINNYLDVDRKTMTDGALTKHHYVDFLQVERNTNFKTSVQNIVGHNTRVKILHSTLQKLKDIQSNSDVSPSFFSALKKKKYSELKEIEKTLGTLGPEPVTKPTTEPLLKKRPSTTTTPPRRPRLNPFHHDS